MVSLGQNQGVGKAVLPLRTLGENVSLYLFEISEDDPPFLAHGYLLSSKLAMTSQVFSCCITH